MDFALDRSAQRFREEQKRARDRELRRKREEDKRKEAAERAKALRISKLQEERRELQLQAVAEERIHLLNVRKGGGVLVTRDLKYVPFRERDEATTRGDRCRLPVSLLEELSSKGAEPPFLFEIACTDDGRNAVEEERQRLRNADGMASNTGDATPLSIESLDQDSGEADVFDAASVTFCGCLEFTAEEGTVEIPQKVLDSLRRKREKKLSAAAKADTKIAEGTEVTLTYAKLPKLVNAKVVCFSREFKDVPTEKSILENNFRQSFVTLAEGDEGDLIDFEVLELQPEPQGSLIDTDLGIEIIQLKDRFLASPSKRSHSLTKLEAGKSVEGAIAAGSQAHFSFLVDSTTAELLRAGQLLRIRSRAIVTAPSSPAVQDVGAVGKEAAVADAALSGDQHKEGSVADADLFVSVLPITRPSEVDHHWSSLFGESREVVIASDDPHAPTEGDTVFVTIKPYSCNVHFELVVGPVDEEELRKSAPLKASIAGNDGEGAAAGSSTAGLKTCENCGRLVPSASYMLHSATCARLNVRCSHPGCTVVMRRAGARDGKEERHVHCDVCGEGMSSLSLPKHRDVHHAEKRCECGHVAIGLDAMLRHRRTSCPFRRIVCRFCGGVVPAGGLARGHRYRQLGLTGHEEECGARTAPCSSCGSLVPLRDMENHVRVIHEGLPPLSSAAADSEGGDAEEKMMIEETKEEQGLPSSAETADTEQKAEEASAPSTGTAAAPEKESRGLSASPTEEEAGDIVCPICGQQLVNERAITGHLRVAHGI